MMEDLNTLARKLSQGPGGDKIASAANSPEARRLMAYLDASGLEKALKTGDSAALKNALESVLSTADGQALASRLREAMAGTK